MKSILQRLFGWLVVAGAAASVASASLWALAGFAIVVVAASILAVVLFRRGYDVDGTWSDGGGAGRITIRRQAEDLVRRDRQKKA